VDWPPRLFRLLRILTMSDTTARLRRLGEAVQAQWPDWEIVVDDRGVWWRDHTRHTDYGIYGTTVTGEIVFCLSPQGHCHLQRSIRES
jgi:hypothetical protein